MKEYNRISTYVSSPEKMGILVEKNFTVSKDAYNLLTSGDNIILEDCIIYKLGEQCWMSQGGQEWQIDYDHALKLVDTALISEE